MDNKNSSPEMVDVERIFLDVDNPRHKSFGEEAQAIEYLCNEADIFKLAKDIVENGLNPLEQFALIKERDNVFVVAEGNRRLCALKLLSDPELAPPPKCARSSQISPKSGRQ